MGHLNSTIRNINNNQNSNNNFFIIFFIVFSFQQNKRYSNAYLRLQINTLESL